MAVSGCIGQHKLNFTDCDGTAIITINEVFSQPHLEGELIFFIVFYGRETIGVPFASLDNGVQKIIDFVVLWEGPPMRLWLEGTCSAKNFGPGGQNKTIPAKFT
ncbi:MAG: hypothetical protein HY649_06145 [Acidobacteria bacterium]|nr:hypothetical protein [Acidobacteriota bacterium]